MCYDDVYNIAIVITSIKPARYGLKELYLFLCYWIELEYHSVRSAPYFHHSLKQWADIRSIKQSQCWFYRYTMPCFFSLSQIPVLHTLQSIVTMLSRIHVLSDLHSMKCIDKSLGARLTETSRTFVTELAYGGWQHGGTCLKRFLETCGSTWLKMHVTDLLLANYSDCVVPLERRSLKMKPLSLEKIVRY